MSFNVLEMELRCGNYIASKRTIFFDQIKSICNYIEYSSRQGTIMIYKPGLYHVTWELAGQFSSWHSNNTIALLSSGSFQSLLILM